MNNNQVVQAWLEARPAKKNNLSTDGKYLYSYKLEIGRWLWSDDHPIVWNYSSKSNHFISRTTSDHVNLAVTKIHQKELDLLLLTPHTQV
tara:strand:- start:221 stop:490 length:270 start_codon:yes stop_codon:yes gene_type:complete